MSDGTPGSQHDALVIGGGFFGVCIASYLVRQRGLKRVCLVEREGELLTRASFHNQARVHNGYHYPRSFTTAFRSRVNLPRFISDWPDAVVTDFTKLYAIARRNSKVTSRQFVKFCREIGATVAPAADQFANLFQPRLIDTIFEVAEWAFDATVLGSWAAKELEGLDVDVRLSTRATEVSPASPAELRVTTVGPGGTDEVVSRLVFNCSYAGINQVGGSFAGVRTGIKQEITEMAMVKVPPALSRVGVTVMDGPFYSLMPFPSRGLHSLSHVRYTPHSSWVDQPGLDPYARLDGYQGGSRAAWMLRDAGRYMPKIAESVHVDSSFEVKAVLMKNENDDGRPILVEQDAAMPGFFSVLGGKIDNIYDVLESLDAASL
ncbi:FAD-dependent oxidoreductase [Nocardioides iriomotensis]|uniref:FAD-binding oxidoreductase n=1 Tax=Nocardioides iriomotensis TaxID=715784 RepID=A0A4Q5IV30_9ACTN|nr:FAD-dependent oxidoreductase [Nocardioides iriomotensis]RYU09653.1 FAD-binding oxidoreductase [Nocardioides iriomotensis]